MKLNAKWNFPYSKIYLNKNEVHIWRAKYSFTSKQIKNFLTLLSDDENKKAFNFYFQSDRNNYIASRAILRLILSRYIHTHPKVINFYYNYYGKPFILDANISFNISHSNELAVFAFSINSMVGIDVEYIHDGFNEMEIAEKFFSLSEINELKSVPQNQRKEAFFNCWTSKEAYIKAKGLSISTPLDSFDVSLLPWEPVKILIRGDNNDEENNWYLQRINIGKGYSSSIALQKRPSSFKLWEWNYTIEVIDRLTELNKIFSESQNTNENERYYISV